MPEEGRAVLVWLGASAIPAVCPDGSVEGFVCDPNPNPERVVLVPVGVAAALVGPAVAWALHRLR